MKRKKIRNRDTIKGRVSVAMQWIALFCLVLIVYIIGRSIVKTSSSSTAKKENTTQEATAETTKSTTEQDDITLEEDEELDDDNEATTQASTSTRTNATSNRNSRATTTRRAATTTSSVSSTEISTQYGQETNQDGNSTEWITEQKDVIELEKDNYDLRSKGTSGIQYVDPNGDVAKVLYQPADSVDGKSYEEYYYQGNELIYASVWTTDGDDLGKQYYFNNGTLIQWVDGDGLIYNEETRGKGFEAGSEWEKYLNAGQKAMKKSRDGNSVSTTAQTSSDTSTSSETSTSTSNT